jgi:hypothetical protein
MISDLTIILQGRCEIEQIKLWIENYSEWNVIISTWIDNNIPFNIPPNWKIIKSEYPERYAPFQNVDYQITSTLNALNLVQTNYVLKVRADEYWSNLYKIYDELNSDEKILCGSMFFRPLDSPYPFHISDHILFGTNDNMKKMFNKAKENLILNLKDNNTPESILGMAYVQSKENYPIQMMFDICKNRNWDTYIKKWFDIIDVNKLKPYIATQKSADSRIYFHSNYTNCGCITKLE